MTRRVRAGAIALAVLWVAAVQGAARREGTAPGETNGQAPARLSETGLFAAGHPDVVDARTRGYAPLYPLWSNAESPGHQRSAPADGVRPAARLTNPHARHPRPSLALAV